MRFAQMSGGARYTKEVTGLNGGLNTQEPPAFLDDRQLPDCLNVYWKEGALHTRPALVTTHETSDDYTVVAAFETADGEYQLIRTNLYLLVYYRDTLMLKEENIGTATTEQHAFFAESGDGNVLMFLTYTVEGVTYRETWEITLSETEATAARVLTPYVPTVFINGRGSTDRLTAGRVTMAEGFNLLTERYRGRWTTDGEATFFRPPFKVGSGSFKAEYTHTDGTVYTFTAWVAATGADVVETSAAQTIPDVGEVYLRVGTLGGECAFCDSTTHSPVALPAVGFAGNLLVEAARDTADEAAVFDMSFSVWFGGDRDSLGGGTRLFLGGNLTEPHIVRYSDVDEPLYFPENNFMYVGDPSQAVTAFGKQNGALVIFKERELFGCEYAYKEAEETAFVDGEVVDVTAAAYFPLTQLHSAVGCDRPQTVRLCGNRLTWAHSDGAVYMLSALSPWSEKGVRCISYAIEPSLKGKSIDAAAVYHGNYLLFCDREVFLFDYMAGAFADFTSYADERRAASAIPWYRWQLPMSGAYHLLGRDDTVTLFVLLTDYEGLTAVRFGEGLCDSTSTGEIPILSRVTTKPFPIGRTGYRGAVYALWLQLGRTGGAVDVTLYGDGADATPMAYRLQTENGDARDIVPVSVPCRQGRVRTLGVTVESTDPLVLAGLSMEFRIWKGA